MISSNLETCLSPSRLLKLCYVELTDINIKDESSMFLGKEVDYMRFKITHAEVQPTMNISTHKSERQVLMQYMKAAHRWSIS
jgi:hypothetical protein